MSQLGVTIPSSPEECREQTGHDPALTPWLDTHTGDQTSPQIRFTLVALENTVPFKHRPQRMELSLR